MVYGPQLIDEFMKRLQGRPPSRQKQARHLLEAMSAVMQKKPVWSVSEVDRRFIQIKGTTGDAEKVAENVKFGARIGRVGEVVIHDSIVYAFTKADMEKHWSIDTVKISVNLIIPVDLRGDFLHYEFDRLKKRAITEAKKMFQKEGGAIADFMFQGEILESKAQYRSRVFPGGQRKTRQPSELAIDMGNEYIRKFAQQGRSTIVGYTLVDAIFDNVGKSYYDQIEENIDVFEENVYRWGKTHGRKTLEVHTDIEKSTSEIFELVGFEIVAFIPEVVDQKNFEAKLAQKIKPMEIKIGDWLLTEIAQRSSQSTKYETKIDLLGR